MSGSDRNRIVSAVGAQSTTTHVPLARRGVRLDVAQAEHLVEAREHRELLGLDRVEPGPVEHLHQIRLDLAPRLLHALLRVELLTGEARRRCGVGIGAELDPERVGRASAPDRCTARACAVPRPRTAARSPPRWSSCRRRPCR